MFKKGLYSYLSFLIVLWMPLINFGLPSTSALTQSGFWSNPISLSGPGSFAWFPEIAADSTGKIHVVWSSGVPGYDMVLYTASKDGITWEKNNDIAGAVTNVNESAATRPAIALDAQGLFHLSYEDNNLFYTHAPITSAGLANSWIPTMQINGKQAAYFSRIVIDGKGTIFLFYTENVPAINCTECFHLFVRQSSDFGKTWSDPIDISGEANGAAKPQAIVDTHNNIHVVWEGGFGGGLGQLTDPTTVNYSASYDGGKTWTKPIQFIAQSTKQAKNITIDQDGSGQLLVVWWNLPEDKLYYQTSDDDGRSWTDPHPIPDVWGIWTVYQSRLDDYSTTTDSGGNIHLAAIARLAEDDKNLSVVDLVWDQSSWSKPFVVSTYTSDAPEWPRIAISGGNQVNMVWFVRDHDHIYVSDKGQYQVWYARGQASSPSTQPQPIPTIKPTLITTSTVSKGTMQQIPGSSLENVSTRVPTLPADLRIPTNGLYSETDYIKILGKALVPSIGLLLMVILFVFIRRR